MATYDYTVGGNTRVGWTAEQPVQIVNRLVDIAAVITADTDGDLGSSTIDAASILQIIDVPDNTYVLQTNIRTITVSTTGTITVDLGDGDEDDRYNEAVDLTATAGTNAWSNHANDSGSQQIGSGHFYSAADTIDLVFNNATTNGIFVVQVAFINFRYQYLNTTTLLSSNV